MASGRQFIQDQDANIKEAKGKFEAAAKAFSRAEEAGTSHIEQERRLDACQAAGREFFRTVNDAVVDSGDLAGTLFLYWKEDRIASALNVLSALPKHQSHIRKHRTRLGISPDKYEFSLAVLENMQAVVAWERPEETKKLREQFAEADLPAGGFDRPRNLEPLSNKASGEPESENVERTTFAKARSQIAVFLSPASLVRAGMKAHPAFKYAMAAAGLIGLVVIITRYGVSPATAVFGVIILVVLMVLFLVFSQAAALARAPRLLATPAIVLVWSFLIMAILAGLFLLTSSFFDMPLPIRTYLIQQLHLEKKNSPGAESRSNIPADLFLISCNESFDGQDTNLTVLNLGTNENMVLLRLRNVPVQNSVQCMLSALFMQGTFRNIKMEQNRNIAYTRLTGAMHPRSLHYEVQYVKDILDTNVIKDMEVRGQEVLIDGTPARF